MTTSGTSAAQPAGMDVRAVLRSRKYLTGVLLAALIGIPVSALAYGFLALVTVLQRLILTDLPTSLFGSTPAWWPIPWLVLGGVLTGLTIHALPGNGGHSPALGFQSGGAPTPRELPAVVLAALASLSLGAVLGPEAPLIALGGGLGLLTVRLVARRGRTVTPEAGAMVAAAGTFAAISTLLGSPLIGAFLILEAAPVGGAALVLATLPGLLAAGIGNLLFVGLGSWTGLGPLSLSLPSLPDPGSPTVAMLAWGAAFGIVAALLSFAIRRGALALRPLVHRSRVLVTGLLGLGVGLCALVFALVSGDTPVEILFSGQEALPGLIAHLDEVTVGTGLLLIATKGVAYLLSLSAFRGGPIFPAMYIGAVLGVLATALPGVPAAAGIAMGIGAMCAAMLGLPLTSTLLATLLLGREGLEVLPAVIVAVVVAYLVTARLPAPGRPGPPAAPGSDGPAPAAPPR